MADDTTRGPRGDEPRGERPERTDRPQRPTNTFPRRDGDARGGHFSREAGPREHSNWRSDRPAPEGRSDRPVRAPYGRPEGGRPPFQSRERSFEHGSDSRGGDSRPDRGGFRDAGSDRPPFRSAPRSDQPFRGGPPRGDQPFRGGAPRSDQPFRDAPRSDQPFREAPRAEQPFRADERPAEREDRPERKPWQREDRGEGRPSAPPWQREAPRRDDRPTYRQGRGGYRSFDQDLNRPERPAFRSGGDRPYRGGQGEDNDRSFRRPEGDRPQFQDRRPSFGAKPFDRQGDARQGDSPAFTNAGRPLGTVTRAGRSPVSQFERIQADIYGRWPVLESLRAGSVTKIYLAAGVRDSADHLQEIQVVAAEKHVTVVRVDRFDLDRVLGSVNHQGIAAACRPFKYTAFEDLLAAAGRTGETPLIVLFDGVQDPQNLGSIVRTAEAAGVDGAILPKHNQAGVTPAVVRASAGATEHLPIAEVTNLRQSIASLKEAGYWIVGLDMEGGTDYDNFDVSSPIALVVGGEGRGVSRMISEECDYLVRLPMRGKVGSLNASVAAGIVLYEIERRRGTANTPKHVQEVVTTAVASEAIAEEIAELEDEELEENLEATFDEPNVDSAELVLEIDEEEEEFLPDDEEEGDEIEVEEDSDEVTVTSDTQSAPETAPDSPTEDEPGAAEHVVVDAGEKGSQPES